MPEIVVCARTISTQSQLSGVRWQWRLGHCAATRKWLLLALGEQNINHKFAQAVRGMPCSLMTSACSVSIERQCEGLPWFPVGISERQLHGKGRVMQRTCSRAYSASVDVVVFFDGGHQTRKQRHHIDTKGSMHHARLRSNIPRNSETTQQLHGRPAPRCKVALAHCLLALRTNLLIVQF